MFTRKANSFPLLLGLATAGWATVDALLHGRWISHGDFYAHNNLYHPDGGCYLGDFGAASFYPSRPVAT